jgi:hypothetical protein
LQIIGHLAFENCKSIESIRLPPKLTFLGIDCFKNCIKLNTIEIVDIYGFQKKFQNQDYDSRTKTCFENTPANVIIDINKYQKIDLNENPTEKFIINFIHNNYIDPNKKKVVEESNKKVVEESNKKVVEESNKKVVDVKDLNPLEISNKISKSKNENFFDVDFQKNIKEKELLRIIGFSTVPTFEEYKTQRRALNKKYKDASNQINNNDNATIQNSQVITTVFEILETKFPEKYKKKHGGTKEKKGGKKRGKKVTRKRRRKKKIS